ncbi:bifunctional isocitrate dehydrogenase kinase/phosphatase [Halomonas cibimaris]|uniref:Isocitrate dehydrogenase kinase/phosphatase n=1 Tax=Halomonas cibimaris TaxID=657012 RepID=A0ABP7LY56_9GAMM
MSLSAAYRLAATVLHGFDEYRARFQAMTREASQRFRDADWQQAQRASAERINLYKEKVDATRTRLERTFSEEVLTNCEYWCEARGCYAQLISQRLDFELAETFFNSLFCTVFHHRHIRNDRAFVYSSRDGAPHRSGIELCRRYAVNGDWQSALSRALVEAPLALPFTDAARDSARGAAFLREALPPAVLHADNAELELLHSVFYRNKGAYLVGRIRGGGEQVPLVLPVLHDDGNAAACLRLDTVLIEPDEVSILFSFTRAYFQVDVPVPGECVAYLQGLMPNKPIDELYASIGFFKHGKTEFFRALNRQVAKREDRFILAPGVPGMVMAVFVLPSHRTVFKIIRDRFDPAKDITHREVREKYQLVKRHDRVGRMADTQEFSNFIARKDHFDPDCLAHLLETAPSTVSMKGDKVLIRHCYTERMMTPLNLYVEHCSEEEVATVLNDYGNAIKQLAAANIFPGDMLLKNFGVTRHGRVIFYDYDEISYLTHCCFRALPRTADGRRADVSALSIGPNDIFPEEFGPFMIANPERRALFTRQHPELFDPDYWQGLQQDIRNGRVIDVYPYRNKQRFNGGRDALVH